MEKISFESIISSLMLLGYDKVDSSLYADALEIIILSELFEIEKKYNPLLRNLIIKEKNLVRLKDNVSINGNVMINNKLVSVRKILEYSSNNLLLDYLKDIKPDNKKMKRLVK